MNVLEPHKGLEIRNLHEENRHIKDIMKDIESKHHQQIANYLISCFKNPKFIKTNIKYYEEEFQIIDLCWDIVMINNIKQAYERDNKLSVIDVAYEENNDYGLEYSYDNSYTPEWEEVIDEIKELSDDYKCDNCFSDIARLCIIIPGGSYYDLLESKIEYIEDFRCKDQYTIRHVYYPVVLEMEKMLLRNKDKFIKLIKEFEY